MHMWQNSPRKKSFSVAWISKTDRHYPDHVRSFLTITTTEKGEPRVFYEVAVDPDRSGTFNRNRPNWLTQNVPDDKIKDCMNILGYRLKNDDSDLNEWEFVAKTPPERHMIENRLLSLY